MVALDVPEGSEAAIAGILARQIAVLRETRLIDAHEIAPDIGFDPRWEDGGPAQ
jgi:hypothetical protein